ncbi:glycosyl transferase [Actinomadura hibisca]|uniref:glycosyl transferase n=1 Tax=Actinomadura hibisca TaxID=68565 RepID=UPI000A848F71|nr:glycosyl transferase [Actinomadura hibisca]
MSEARAFSTTGDETAGPPTSADPPETDEERRPFLSRAAALDLAAAGGFLLASLFVYARLWSDPTRRYLVNGGQDQTQWEWFFAVTARSVSEFHDPLFTHLQNAPLGVNLMANTVMLGLSVPLTPVTLLFGASVTWAVVLTGGLAATGFAWYWLFSRRLGRSRVAAGVAGAFCAFAPPVISHANAHPNFVVLFAVPFVIDRIVVLWRGERPVRNGVLLGLLIAYQIFLGEEILLLAATGLAVFGVGYALARPDAVRAAVRPLLAGLGTAAAVSLAITAYPLARQFAGEQSYASLLHGPAGNDLLAITGFADRSWAGPTVLGPFGVSTTEQNAFFGWPLVILTVVLACWMWRQATAAALALVIVVCTVLSLGPEIVVGGEPTGITGPWLLMSKLPLYESVLESRLTMVCIPAVALLVAMATDQVLGVAQAAPWRAAPLRMLWCVVLAQALLPIAPKPLLAEDRPPTPPFFTQGVWKRYAAPGRTIVTVPPPNAANATALHWQVEAGLGFALAEGYFVGPYGPERTGVYGAVPRPTASLLRDVADKGQVPAVTDAERETARADLRYWRADAVVLGPRDKQAALRATVEQLLGPGRWDGGVWVWDVRAITRGG